MDPVNKWLLTVILFMAAVVIMIGYKAGSGRYSLVVDDGIMYVLDTKDGDIQAKALDSDDLFYQNKPRNNPVKVFEQPSGYKYRRGY